MFDEDGAVIGVQEDTDRDALLGDVYRLSKKEKTDHWCFYNSVKGPTKKSTNFHPDEIPTWSLYWTQLGRTGKQQNISSSTALNLSYRYMCCKYFNVLEPTTRVKKRIDKPLSKAIVRERPAPESDNSDLGAFSDSSQAHEPRSKRRRRDRGNDPGTGKRQKRKRTTKKVGHRDHLDCAVPRPVVRGSKRRPCRICGYVISKLLKREIKAGRQEAIEFPCCGARSHVDCWLNARAAGSTTASCAALKYLLMKDRHTAIFVNYEDPDKEVIKNYAVCEFCGDEIDTAGDSDDHILNECIVLADLRASRRFEFRVPADVDAPARKMALVRKEARAGLMLACSKLSIQFGKRRTPTEAEGVRSSHESVRRTVAADSQVT